MKVVVCLLFFLLLALAFETEAARKGADVSQPTSLAAFQCMKASGYEWVSVRCYQSNGVSDPNVAYSVNNAHAAGIGTVDVYMFPCPLCGTSAAAQVNQAVAGLSGVSYSRFWIDVEGTQYWSTDKATNQAFFNGLVAQARALGLNIGIYTNPYQWDALVGLSFTGGSAYPLWVAQYDGEDSFAFFAPFGGWTAPYVKQKSDTTQLCNVGVDLNWLGDGAPVGYAVGDCTKTPGGANIRSCASTGCSALFQSNPGETMTVRSATQTYNNGYFWLAVTARGQNGYVASTLTNTCGGTTGGGGNTGGGVIVLGQCVKVVASPYLNLRSGSSTTYAIVGQAATGTQLQTNPSYQQVYDSYSGLYWTPLQYNGGLAWGASSYLTSCTSKLAEEEAPTNAATNSATARAIEPRDGTCVATTTQIRIRSCAGLSCLILFTSSTGQVFQVDTSTGHQYVDGYDWTPLISNGQRAWGASVYLTGTTCPGTGGGGGSGGGSCPSLPLFKQGNYGDRLGGSGCTETIASAGCAMTSVTMAMWLYGYRGNPSDMNTFLQNNGGYSGCLIYWSTPAALPYGQGRAMSASYGAGQLSLAQLQAFVDNCQPVVVWVRNYSHWVLLWGGYSGSTFNCLDPGYSSGTYDFSEMTGFKVYPRS